MIKSLKNALKKYSFILALLVLGAGAYYYYQNTHQTHAEDLYKLDEITQGDIEKSASANGTLNPVILVTVGTQVTGIVHKLYVDFNDQVKKDQLLLELDDSLFNAQIELTQGNIRNTQASVELAQANEARIKSLYAQDFISKQELDTATQVLKSAKAQLSSTQAQLKRDQTNLGFSKVRSPVSGVVIDRQVDVGQTVQASLQAPALFQIAQDLSKMQISTSFAEADIGNIKVGQKVKFTVDAYPNRDFEGVVKQLRLNPTITTNVVTYNAVVTVDNGDQVLLPGMTAYVNIGVAKHDNVLLVPNAALRYKPSVADSNTNADAEKKSSGNQSSGNKHSGKKFDKKDGPNGGFGKGKIYVLRADSKQNNNPQPVLIKVKTGITDGRMTEVSSAEIKVGDKIVISETQSSGQSGGNSGNRMPRMY